MLLNPHAWWGDEDAPAQIEDPDASMPEGWDEDAPETIDDPDAEMPDDWDEEEDGEWEAPKIRNPVCDNPGCDAQAQPSRPTKSCSITVSTMPPPTTTPRRCAASLPSQKR